MTTIWRRVDAGGWPYGKIRIFLIFLACPAGNSVAWVLAGMLAAGTLQRGGRGCGGAALAEDICFFDFGQLNIGILVGVKITLYPWEALH